MKRYDSYKDSGVEWIGEVPSHWNTLRGKYMLSILSGFPFDSKKFEYDDNYMPLIRIRDINSSSTEVYYSGDYPKESVVKKGEVLIGMDGDFNVSRWNGPDALLNQRVCKINENSKMNTRFAFYMLSLPLKIINDVTYATTVKHLSVYDIYNTFLPEPTIAEQEDIANYLDKKCSEIDNVISAQQKRIALLQELKQSIITHAVTKGLNPNVEMKDSGVEWIGRVPRHWEVYKIKNCCKTEQYSIKTGPFGTQLKGEDLQPQGDVAVYSQQNVINNDFTKVRYFVSNKKAETLKGFYTRPNDVLVTSRGTIGKAAILSSSFPNGILHPCLIALRLNQDICLNDWLVMYINETDCFKTDVYLSSNATTIDVIYTGTLKNIYIPIPPHEEQLEILKSIREKCASIDASLSKAQHQVELLQEYKQSLITEVVTGKRKVL